MTKFQRDVMIFALLGSICGVAIGLEMVFRERGDRMPPALREAMDKPITDAEAQAIRARIRQTDAGVLYLADAGAGQ